MILWIIACIACFVLGDLKGQGKLNWVRGVAGKARDAVLGAAPARTLTEVSPPRPKNPIRAGQAVKNILAFFGGLLAWMAKNPMLAIGLVLLAALLVFGLPFGIGKSKGELRLEREIAEMNETIRAHEARVNELSRDLAVNTERDRTRRAQVIAQAEQELGNAAAQIDPDALYDVYAAQYLCLLDARACASSSDSAPSRTPPVRGSSASPA